MSAEPGRVASPSGTGGTAEAWALVEEQIISDRALYDAAGITEPVECSRCGRSVETFRDESGTLRMEGHRARLDVWCGGGGHHAR